MSALQCMPPASRCSGTIADKPSLKSTRRELACGCHGYLVQWKVQISKDLLKVPVVQTNTLIYFSCLFYVFLDKAAHHQEEIAAKMRQMKKREAEGDMKDAPPQSLAFSYTEGNRKWFTCEFLISPIWSSSSCWKYRKPPQNASVMTNQKLTCGW